MNEIIDKLKADLAYRLPVSGKPLGALVLERERAQALVEEFDRLIAMLVKP